MSALSPDQLDDLQAFLKDWLRHTGRTQADLRRALRASSIRMPVLVDELHRTYASEGLTGLAQRLCRVEALWQGEDQAGATSALSETAGEDSSEAFAASLGQLDLLLEEIRRIDVDSSLPD
ncbi:MAG: hypothetical protein VKO65_02955 [Cyanobacteriota bacterium]|nr:hypothetical protein [Cyanobacteriota bacterium]